MDRREWNLKHEGRDKGRKGTSRTTLRCWADDIAEYWGGGESPESKLSGLFQV